MGMSQGFAFSVASVSLWCKTGFAASPAGGNPDGYFLPPRSTSTASRMTTPLTTSW